MLSSSKLPKNFQPVGVSTSMRHQLAGNSLAICLMKAWFKFAEKKASVLEAIMCAKKMVFGLSFAGCRFWRLKTTVKKNWSLLRKLYVATGLSLAATITSVTIMKDLRPSTPSRFGRYSPLNLKNGSVKKEVLLERTSRTLALLTKVWAKIKALYLDTLTDLALFSVNPAPAHLAQQSEFT